MMSRGRQQRHELVICRLCTFKLSLGSGSAVWRVQVWVPPPGDLQEGQPQSLACEAMCRGHTQHSQLPRMWVVGSLARKIVSCSRISLRLRGLTSLGAPLTPWGLAARLPAPPPVGTPCSLALVPVRTRCVERMAGATCFPRICSPAGCHAPCLPLGAALSEEQLQPGILPGQPRIRALHGVAPHGVCPSIQALAELSQTTIGCPAGSSELLLAGG